MELASVRVRGDLEVDELEQLVALVGFGIVLEDAEAVDSRSVEGPVGVAVGGIGAE